MSTSSLPLLLFPGLMNDERVWHPVLEHLGTTAPCVIAPTHTDTGVQALAAAAIARMPAGPFAVAGFSLGGYVALEVCRQVPGRVSGLALIGSGARADAPESRAMRQRMIDATTSGGGQSGGGQFGSVAEGFLPRVLHPANIGNAELVALLAGMARAVGADGFVRQQTTAMHRPDSLETLRAWRKPTLVLCGAGDQITPCLLSEEMAAAVPGAELVTVPDSGHMVLIEAPAATAAAMRRWLDAL